MFRTSLLTGALLLVGCGDDPLFLVAKAAVCQHLPGQRFRVPNEVREQYARLPVALQQGIELERTFDFDVTAELPPEAEAMQQTHLALTSVRLTAVNAADDLGFIDEAHLQVHPQASSGLETRVFDYVRTEAAPRSVHWNGEAFDVARYLQSGNLKYTVSMVGSLPPGDVVVDIVACAEVAVNVDYL